MDPSDIASVRDFGAALTELRLARGLSVRDVARHAQNIPASTLGGYFAGRHLPPPTRPEVLTGLLTALEVPPQDQASWHRTAQRLHVGRLPRNATPNPYRGLAAYDVGDSALFFGREDITEQITTLIRATIGQAAPGEPPIVVVLGPSGSGKSSVLRAGVIANLADWACAVITPGADPIGALTSAAAELADDGGHAQPTLLVIDQLEEVWTLASASTRNQFFDEVAAWAGQGSHRVVVLGLRADFFASATEQSVLLDALRSRQVVVGPMGREDLRRIITAPAAAVGVDLTPELVDHMLADADPHSQDGAVVVLPHLSHALLLMWFTGDRRRLTGDDYARVGGIRGAVTRSADDAFDSLPPSLRPLARRALLRLVVVEANTTPTSAVVSMSTLNSLGRPDDVRQIIDHFAASRLLTVSEDGCRFSHEAVIDSWELLRDWIATDRTRLGVAHLVDREADAWAEAEHDDGLLLRGHRLKAALEWAGEDPPAPDSRAARYLTASSDAEERAAHERERGHRRVRRWLAATVVLALITTAATVLSVRARMDADRRNLDSVSRQIAVASGSLTSTNTSLGHQLGVAAYQTADSTEARGALLDATAGLQVTRHLPGAGQRTLATNVDQGLVAVTGPDGQVYLHRSSDLETPLGSIEVATDGAADFVFAAAFAPDGRTLAVGGTSGVVRLLDVTDPGQPTSIAEVSTPDMGTVYALAWSLDGSIVSAGTEKLGVQRWRAGAQPRSIPVIPMDAVGGLPQALTVLPGTGDLVVGSSTTGDVSVWRGSRQPRRVSKANVGAPVVSLAARPGASTIAVGTQAGTVVILPAEDGRLGEQTSLSAGVTWINALTWDPNGERLYAGSSDLTVRSWNNDGVPGREVAFPGLVTALVFADPDRVIAGLSTGEVHSWLTRGPELFPDATSAFSASWVDGGQRLIAFVGRPTNAAIVYDTTDPMQPRELGRTAPVPTRCGLHNSTGSASADAALVVIGTSMGCLVGLDLRDPTRPVTRFVVQPSTQQPQQIRVRPDASGFLTGGDDRVVRWWTLADDKPKATVLDGPKETILDVDLSSDGRLAAASSLDDTVHLWRLPAGPRDPQPVSPLGVITLPSDAITVAFDPHGPRLAVGGTDPEIQIFDISAPEEPRQVQTLTGLTAAPFGLTFDADGGLGAALSNGRVNLWNQDRDGDLQSWTVLRAGAATPSLLATLRWHPDGKHLLAVGTAGMSRIWLTDPSAARDFVCHNAGVPMTAEEWSASVAGVPFTRPCPQR